MIHEASMVLAEQDITRKKTTQPVSSKILNAEFLAKCQQVEYSNEEKDVSPGSGTQPRCRSLAQHFKTSERNPYHQAKEEKPQGPSPSDTKAPLKESPLAHEESKLGQRNIFKLRKLMHQPPEPNSVLNGGKAEVCLLKRDQDQNASLLQFTDIPKTLASAMGGREEKR